MDYHETYKQYHSASAAVAFKPEIEHMRQYVALLKNVPRDAPLLDIGCGWGFFLSAAQSEGFTDICGIDLSPGQVTECINRGISAEVTPDAIAYLTAKPGHFGVITLFDVVEHFPQDKQIALMQAVALALRPGGICIVKVPNASSTVGLYMRYNDLEHTTVFTSSSLNMLVTFGGLTPLSTTDEIPYLNKPGLHPRSLLYYVYYQLIKKVFRWWRRLEIQAELGGETAANAVLAPNLFCMAIKQ